MSGSTSPVLKINVDDSKFIDFQKKFVSLQQQMAKGMNLAVTGSGGGTGLVPQWDQFKKAVEASYLPLKRVRDAIGDMAKSLVSSVKSLIQFTGIASLLTGVVGFGSLFGIRGLAESASQQRMSALGIGAPTGQINSFSSSYGRYLGDPTGFMGRVAEMQRDPSKLGQMSALLGIQNAGQMSVYDLSKAIVNAMPAASQRFGNNSQLYSQLGFSDIMSWQEAQRLRNVSPQELARTGREADANVSRLGLSDTTESGWQDFLTHMKNAGTEIENSFITALVKLHGPLGHLADSVGNFIKHLSENPNVGRWIDDLAHGLDRFATYVNSNKFEKDIDHWLAQLGEFSDNMGKAIGGLDGFITALSAITTAIGWVLSHTFGYVYQAGQATGTFLRDHADGIAGGIGTVVSAADQAAWYVRAYLNRNTSVDPAGVTGPAPGQQSFADVHAMLNQIDAQSGVPQGTTWANFMAETTAGTARDMMQPHGDDIVGPLQESAAFRRDYGVTSRSDLYNQALGETRAMREFLIKYHGDLDKARVAYNLGPGKADELFKDHAQDWYEHLGEAAYGDPGAKSALDKFRAAYRDQNNPSNMGAIAPVQIQVTTTNVTGANTQTTVSQSSSNTAPGGAVPR